MACFDRLTRLVNKKLHPVQLDQQVIRELDVGLIDLINEEHDLLVRIESLPQLATLNVVGNVVNTLASQLRVSKSRDRVILIETLLRLGGRLNVPLYKSHPQTRCDFLGQHGFARSGLALNQQWPLQCDRGVNRHSEVVGGYIIVSARKFHSTAPYSRGERLTDDSEVYESFYAGPAIISLR